MREGKPVGFPWWVVEDATGWILGQSKAGESGEEPACPPRAPEVRDVVHVFALSVLTPAQIQAMLDPVIEIMHRVVQLRRTGEIEKVER